MKIPESLHSATHSVFQSAVNEVLHKQADTGGGLNEDHRMMRAASSAMSAKLAGKSGAVKGTIEACAHLYFDLAKAKIAGHKERVQQIENELKDSFCDPGWAEALKVFSEYYALHKKPTYNDEQIDSWELPAGARPDKLTVGLLGDWGSGAEVAVSLLDKMVEIADPDLIIHVGDVYYAGTRREYRHNFNGPLNQVRTRNRPIPVYNLPGNHDYYSGGKAFYQATSELNEQPYAPAGTPIQNTSYFCLRNDGWQLQGMDTGYHDHDYFRVKTELTRLRESEAAWHQQMIESAGDRKIILLSHNQLFSAFSQLGTEKSGTAVAGNYNKYLYQVFGPHIEAQKITAWFWGHEHLLEVYDSYLGLDKGRCVGHSAFPQVIEGHYQVEHDQVPLLPDPANPSTFIKLGTSDEVYNHGFAVLELGAGQRGRALYYQMPGDGSSDACSLQFTEDL